MIRSCTRDMVEAWARRDDPEAPLDLEDAMQNLAFRIIGHVLFGTDLQAEESQAFSDALAVTLEYAAGATNPFRLPTAIPTPTNVRYRRAIQLFDATVKDMLEKRRSSAEQPHDLMTMLLTTVDPETGEGLAHEYLRGEMLSYLTAGHETVATALTWVFYLLSRHPLVARKLDDEIRAVLGDEPASFGKLDELVYTEQVLMETLRLYPPVFMLTREVQSEDRLGEYTIPAKSWVLLAPYLTHRRPDLWDNPEGFDPERFAPGAHAARAALSHFPFFAGPHKCIGEGLAYAEMKIVLATVLQRCRLDLVAGFTPVPGPHVTLRTRDGMKMQPRWR